MIMNPAMEMDMFIGRIYALISQIGLFRFVLYFELLIFLILLIDILSEFIVKYLTYKKIPKLSIRRCLLEFFNIHHFYIFFFCLLCLMSYYPNAIGCIFCFLIVYLLFSFLKEESPLIRVKRENLKDTWFNRKFPYFIADNPEYKKTLIDNVLDCLYPNTCACFPLSEI